MKITSRKDAILQGVSKYFTGEECKNGHIAERYVQSGSCEGCIASSNQRGFQSKSDRRVALSDLMHLKVTLHYGDVAEFKQVMLAVSSLRWASITMTDLLTGKPPQARGNEFALYTFKVFQADFKGLTALQDNLNQKRA